jgi:CRP-like cAMP-binding protein
MIVQLEPRTAAGAATLAEVSRSNWLLSRLDVADREALERTGRVVALTSGQVLFEPGDEIHHVWFVNRGAISMVTVMADGTAVESLMVGCEGATELLAAPAPHRATLRAVVQIPGEALRVDASRLRELVADRPGVRAVMDLHQSRILTELQQTAACNAVHRLEPRLAKWLLNSHDRAGTDVLPLTQEFLGDMLGAQRTTVTAVASALQKTGAISYKRGRITVLDRKTLERASCECYAAAQARAKVAARPL